MLTIKDSEKEHVKVPAISNFEKSYSESKLEFFRLFSKFCLSNHGQITLNYVSAKNRLERIKKFRQEPLNQTIDCHHMIHDLKRTFYVSKLGTADSCNLHAKA